MSVPYILTVRTLHEEIPTDEMKGEQIHFAQGLLIYD